MCFETLNLRKINFQIFITKSVIAADKAHAAASVERDFEKEHKDEMQRLCDKIEALQEE